jgi:hypothetical protein
MGAPIVCDGCRVREPWEHRCHGRMARVGDEPTGRSCECAECSEPVDRVHRIGCICETCSATYEREAWDPRMGAK